VKQIYGIHRLFCWKKGCRDRNLTNDQLEDRIIPDCGLDANGKRSFDFGDRRFQFALGADLKAVVRDEKGKHLTTLPKPGAKDDAEKAQQAIADWKLLKKQMGEIVKIQSVRLEDAMITERHWPWAEFSSLLVQHPLLIHLVQRLIWETYSPEGTLTQTFRVSEDRTYADCSDNAFTPDESTVVGIIHPINLSEDLKAQWGQTSAITKLFRPLRKLIEKSIGYVLKKLKQKKSCDSKIFPCQVKYWPTPWKSSVGSGADSMTTATIRYITKTLTKAKLRLSSAITNASTSRNPAFGEQMPWMDVYFWWM
jgi:Domain of unknown function (DUF4132)